LILNFIVVQIEVK